MTIPDEVGRLKPCNVHFIDLSRSISSFVVEEVVVVLLLVDLQTWTTASASFSSRPENRI
jgi:hypothetical protein